MLPSGFEVMLHVSDVNFFRVPAIADVAFELILMFPGPHGLTPC